MKKENSRKLIMLSGGGTGGSVTPLLALADYLRQADSVAYDFIFVGTGSGPEKYLVESSNILFLSILAGKWRRYFSIRNFFDIFKIIYAFFQSLHLLSQRRPDLLISAGGFVSVPLAYAACFWGIPVLVHQQDIRAGLANKLMARVAAQVTVTFEKSVTDYGVKAKWVGNPTSDSPILELNLKSKYNLDGTKPLLLVAGGGTGSVFINWLVRDSLEELLSFCQIVHISGRGKLAGLEARPGYVPLPFVAHADFLSLLKKSQVLVSRCGLGVLTEISTLGSSAILIPMPNSHQEDNAAIFAEKKAALVLPEAGLSTDIFVSQVKNLMKNKELHNRLCSSVSSVIKSANASLKKIIDGLLS